MGDTPDDFMKVLSPGQLQLQAFCIKLKETLQEQYKTGFDFHNLTSDKEGYYQSANIIDNLCEDPQALVMFQQSFAKLGKKFDPTKITISLCGAGSSKVHVNKYILSHNNNYVAVGGGDSVPGVRTFKLSSRTRYSQNTSINFKPATYEVNLKKSTVTQGFKKSGKQ